MTVNWKQTAIVLLDIIIAIYLLLAITVFNQPEDKATVCTEVNINIANGQNHGFLSPADVKQLLEKQRQYPLAQPMQFVSTRKMEETLRKNPYIANAECYKTQNGHITIQLQQRNPVLHVMDSSGEQYYIDDEDMVLEDGKYYPLMRVKRPENRSVEGGINKQSKQCYNDVELRFGPVLIRKKHPIGITHLNTSMPVTCTK